MNQTITPTVALAYRYGDTTPNCWHFANAYEALAAIEAGRCGRWNEAVLQPSRDGKNAAEYMSQAEFFAWAEASQDEDEPAECPACRGDDGAKFCT